MPQRIKVTGFPIRQIRYGGVALGNRLQSNNRTTDSLLVVLSTFCSEVVASLDEFIEKGQLECLNEDKVTTVTH